MLESGVLVNGAVNIVVTAPAATYVQTVAILAAANTGTTTIAAASMTAEEAALLTYDATGDDTITALSIVDTVTVNQALDIYVDDVNGNIGTVNLDVQDTLSAIFTEAKNGSDMLANGADTISVVLA